VLKKQRVKQDGGASPGGDALQVPQFMSSILLLRYWPPSDCERRPFVRHQAKAPRKRKPNAVYDSARRASLARKERAARGVTLAVPHELRTKIGQRKRGLRAPAGSRVI